MRLNLLIAGDGTEAENIRAYAQAKLADRTQFLGYVRGTAKATVFSSADIYVMPTSYGEGLPVSLLEAMTFGLPVITRPVGGLKDIFIDGQHGFITESTDPEVIAGLIEKLLADPPLWRSICRQTHQFACENFLGSMVAANAAAIFRQVYDTSRISVSSDKNAKTLD